MKTVTNPLLAGTKFLCFAFFMLSPFSAILSEKVARDKGSHKNDKKLHTLCELRGFFVIFFLKFLVA